MLYKGELTVSLFIIDDNQVEQIHGMTAEYPYCMIISDMTAFTVPWHWHEELELGYVETGVNIIQTDNASYTIHQGEGFFINSNVMDTKLNGIPGEVTIEVNHLFHPYFLGGHFQSRFFRKYINPVINNRQIEVHVIRDMTAPGEKILKNLKFLKQIQEKENQEFQTRNLLSETWLLLMEELEQSCGHSQLPENNQHRIRAMISFIHHHYPEKLSLKDIASSANISEREASRCFKKHLKKSPCDYLTTYRLEEARKLLFQTELTVTEIGYRTGFSTSAHFGQVFRRAFGMSPLEYRASHIR